MAMILVDKGPGQGKSLLLDKDAEYLIGSDEICNLVLPSKSIKPKHLALRYYSGTCQVEELEGTGDLYVDGKRHVRKHLLGGELIRIGNSMLEYRSDRLAPILTRVTQTAMAGGGRAGVLSKVVPNAAVLVALVVMATTRDMTVWQVALVGAVLLVLFYVIEDWAQSFSRTAVDQFSKRLEALLRDGVSQPKDNCGIAQLDETMDKVDRYVRTVKEGVAGTGGAVAPKGTDAYAAAQVVNLLDVPAAAVDGDNRVRATNRAFLQAAGIREDLIRNAHLLDLSRASEGAAGFVDAIKEVQEKGEAPRAGMQIWHKAGKWNVTLLRLPQGSSFIDIYAFFS